MCPTPELDYVKLTGSLDLRDGAIHMSDGKARVLYEPDTHFNGVDSFSFTASDCAYLTARTATSVDVTIDVAAVNDAPVA